MSKTIVSFLEEKKIIENIDKLATERGSDRSAIIRECIRKEMLRLNRKTASKEQNHSIGE